MNHFQPRRESTKVHTKGIGTMKRLIVLAVALFAGSASASENCGLHQVDSLDMQQLPDGRLGVGVTIEKSLQFMTLDVSSPNSVMYTDYAEAQKFAASHEIQAMRGNFSTRSTNPIYTVPEFSLGKVVGANVQFVGMPRPDNVKDKSVGSLALDLLATFDVELDFKNNKMNLFSKDHCEGKVVYWANSYTALKFKTDLTGHPNFEMYLDGKLLSAAFNIQSPLSTMGRLTAKRIFGIDETSPGMTLATSAPAGASSVYRYPFKLLGAGGVSIGNPKILLYPQKSECTTKRKYISGVEYSRCFGGSDVYIGLAEMRQLHLYFAFDEKKLYITAADAHR